MFIALHSDALPFLSAITVHCIHVNVWPQRYAKYQVKTVLLTTKCAVSKMYNCSVILVLFTATITSQRPRKMTALTNLENQNNIKPTF